MHRVSCAIRFWLFLWVSRKSFDNRREQQSECEGQRSCYCRIEGEKLVFAPTEWTIDFIRFQLPTKGLASLTSVKGNQSPKETLTELLTTVQSTRETERERTHKHTLNLNGCEQLHGTKLLRIKWFSVFCCCFFSRVVRRTNVKNLNENWKQWSQGMRS